MSIPTNLLYTKDHEWARIENDEAVFGITTHAQESLGEIVFVELPKVGRELKAHETFGVVESIKAVSDLYSPLAGKVVAINDAVVSNPGSLNQDSYDSGWLIRIKLSDKAAVQSLMKPSDYETFVKGL